MSAGLAPEVLEQVYADLEVIELQQLFHLESEPCLYSEWDDDKQVAPKCSNPVHWLGKHPCGHQSRACHNHHDMAITEPLVLLQCGLCHSRVFATNVSWVPI